MGYAATVAAAIQVLQAILLSLQVNLGLYDYDCPTSTTIETIKSLESFDFIIVGGGDSGSVLAHRLSKAINVSILMLEQGGNPPLESTMPGLFTMLPLSSYDSQMNIYNDSYSCQNLKSQGGATCGNMTGGSSAINHMIYVPPCESDYDDWVTAANCSSWSYDNMKYYFAKGEAVTDDAVLAQNTTVHGTDGPTMLKRQLSSSVTPLIEAWEEMGLTYLNDTYGECTSQPLLTIGDGKRQSGCVSYLKKITNPDFHILTNAVVTKIIFENTTATGVQFIYAGNSYNVTANKEIIISAGAIKTPQLLMLSGIGDADALAEWNITSVVNNTQVGKNLMDHEATVLCFKLDSATASTAATDYSLWPVPMLTAYVKETSNTTVIAKQDIMLLFPPASPGFLQLCTNGFKYKDEICDKWYSASASTKLLMMVSNHLHPKSRGNVTLQSTDISVQPTIFLNLLSDCEDLETFAPLVMAGADIVNTTTFKNLGAEFIDPGVCPNITKYTSEFWKCYTKETSSTMWHYSGTCQMGAVVDKNLNVYNTTGLRVVDASVMPALPSGNIGSCVHAVAEKGADMIIKEHGLVIQ